MLCILITVCLVLKTYFARLSAVWGDSIEVSIVIGRFIHVVTVSQPLIENGQVIENWHPFFQSARFWYAEIFR